MFLVGSDRYSLYLCIFSFVFCIFLFVFSVCLVGSDREPMNDAAVCPAASSLLLSSSLHEEEEEDVRMILTFTENSFGMIDIWMELLL